MPYGFIAIPDVRIPRAADPAYQHLLDTYVSEINKAISVWRCFADADLPYRPHAKSATVGDVFRHELLSERRFFGEFLGCPEPAADAVLPQQPTIEGCCTRLTELALPRLAFLADRPQGWWLEPVPFFGEPRTRIWIFWRRILHTCHHRTQLTVYLRLLDRAVPSTYGPTADETWQGADPTQTVEAARRR
jgi:uncharacterized damage-inducible protein DinB